MKNSIYIVVVSCTLALACGSKPKVIAPTSPTADIAPTMEEPTTKQSHEVVVEDFLHASRYTYLQVQENDESFWIAIPYTDVEKGEKYYYQGGVRMHNFESKEHNRVFETLYLVGGVSKIPMTEGSAPEKGYIDMHGGKEPITVLPTTPIEGGTKLSELFTDSDSFAGKTIKVQGTCVKVNRNIMGKNWIHIQDGTTDDKNNNHDLTISTQEDVPEGKTVVFEGTIATNRDFGSGYRYDVIMEEGRMLY